MLEDEPLPAPMMGAVKRAQAAQPMLVAETAFFGKAGNTLPDGHAKPRGAREHTSDTDTKPPYSRHNSAAFSSDAGSRHNSFNESEEDRDEDMGFGAMEMTDSEDSE